METKKTYTVQQKFEVWYEVEVEASDDAEAMMLAADKISEGEGWQVDESLMREETFWVSEQGSGLGETYENGVLVGNAL